MKAKTIRVQTGNARILAVSDLHGSLDLFQELLEKCSYHPGEDVLVIVGDLVEKGPDCLGTLRSVMALAQQEKVYVLSGNCDSYVWERSPEEMWEYVRYWQEQELQWQMGQEAGLAMPQSPEEMRPFRQKLEELYPQEFAFLRGLPHILETERVLFAHAGLQGENLEQQEKEYVTSVPLFPRGTDHRFSKLLVVGHYPTANYREEEMSNAPFYHPQQNVLSIDGGNGVKHLGQLNGVIQNGSGKNWAWHSVQPGEPLACPCSQQEQAGQLVVWPHNQVERVQCLGELTLCRLVESGVLLEIPQEFLYEQEGKVFAGGITSKQLALQQGEPVTLLRRYEDRLLLAKEDGEIGWLVFP